jgi:hypothetical protein
MENGRKVKRQISKVIRQAEEEGQLNEHGVTVERH